MQQFPSLWKQFLQPLTSLLPQQSNHKLSYTNIDNKKYILKLPLQFTYHPVQILSKQLTKLNSSYKQRIIYLGPRWGDTVVWYRNYSIRRKWNLWSQDLFAYNNLEQGFYFNQKRVFRNNHFMDQTMKANKHFKNQLYYRAFEGMNPTLKHQDNLIFQSRFQSGNLDCVVKVAQNQYDLFLRIDSNTRGNTFWFYFEMWSTNQLNDNTPKKIKLNICNITKSKTLYEKNLKPYVKRQKRKPHKQGQWIQGQGIQNCSFKQKKFRYKFIYDKIKACKAYELSFDIQIANQQKVSLAYCIPYTYSNLIKQLKVLQEERLLKKLPTQITISKLGQTLTGLQIPMIIIGNITSPLLQKIILITGRIHPGQTNASIQLSSLIQEFCYKKTQVFTKLIFIIIPMINIDGVVIGNGRCSALGKDLNREFNSNNAVLNKEVVRIKDLIDRLQEEYQVQMYLDFHGHSKKKNVFLFGPTYNVTQINYYRSRVFPKLLSKNIQFFRYFSCNYNIPSTKKTTARAIMTNQFNIKFFYTIQTSIGYYYDYLKRVDVPFTKQILIQMGKKFHQTIKQYFEGVEQYQNFIKKHRKNKQNQIKQLETIEIKVSPEKDIKKVQNQLKFIKVFQQIKIDEKKFDNNKRFQQQSQTQSDSCNADQQLQLQKMKELTQMIVTFKNIQQKKLGNINQPQIKYQSLAKDKRIINSTKRQRNSFSESVQFKQFFYQNAMKHQNRLHSNKINQFRTKIKQWNSYTQRKIDQSINLKLIQNKNENEKHEVIQIKVKNQSFKMFDFEIQPLSPEPLDKLKIVNFSKMIQNPKSLRYCNDSPKNKQKAWVRKRNISYFQKNNISLIRDEFKPFQRRQSLDLQEIPRQSSPKAYPSSFYRIKYQTSHRKNRQKSQKDVINKNSLTLQPSNCQSRQKERQKLFININKIEKN